MSAITLMLPGASVYQYFEHQKLEKGYDHAIELARKYVYLTDVPIFNQRCKLDAADSNCKRLYNACEFIDVYEGWGAIVSAAKAVSFVALGIIFASAGLGFVATVCIGLAFEGVYQIGHSLYQKSKNRWHIIGETNVQLEFIYNNSLSYPVICSSVTRW